MPINPAIPVDQSYLYCTMFFQDNRGSWSETHVYNSTSKDPLVASAPFNNLITARAQMLGSNCFLIDRRISVGKSPKQYLTTDVVVPTGVGDTDNVLNDAILLQMNGIKDVGARLGLYHSSTFIGGVPDVCVVRNAYVRANAGPPPIGNAFFDQQFSSYAALLINNAAPPSPWGFLPLSREDGQAPLTKVVGGSFVQITGLLTVFTDVNHQMVTGDIVRLSRLPWVSSVYPFNRTWRVASAPDAKTLTIVTTGGTGIDINNIEAGGTARKQVRTFVSYFSIARTSATTRRRGNRYFAPVGRRRTKRTVGF